MSVASTTAEKDSNIDSLLRKRTSSEKANSPISNGSAVKEPLVPANGKLSTSSTMKNLNNTTAANCTTTTSLPTKTTTTTTTTNVTASTSTTGTFMKLKTYLLALRPWSLSASLVPTLLGSALAFRSQWSAEFSFITFFLTAFTAVTVHCAGNVVNTYFDFIKGIDKQKADDRTLVDHILTKDEVSLFTMYACSFVYLYLRIKKFNYNFSHCLFIYKSIKINFISKLA